MTIASGQPALAADVLGRFVSKIGDTMTGDLKLNTILTVNGTGQNTISNGSLYIGQSDFRRATFWAQGDGNQIAQISRIGSAASDVGQLQSFYVVNHNGGTARNIFNTQITTSAQSSPAGGTWNFLAGLTTTSAYPDRASAGAATQVAGYTQAVRTAVTGGAEGVSLIGHVVEMHDFVDQPSSTRGAALTLELDWAGNNVDDDDSTGVVSIDLSLASDSGSDLLVGNGIGFYGNTRTAVKRAIDVNVPFTQAVLDTRNATQKTGAHAVWLASNQDIALSSDGKWGLGSDGTGIQFLYSGGVLGSFDQFSNFHAPGGVTSGGAITFSGGGAISWDYNGQRFSSTGPLGLFNQSGNSITTNFGVSLGSAVPGGSDVNIITPNGSNIGIIPQGNGVVKIGGGGVGTLNVGTINGGNITVPIAQTGLTPTFVQSVLLAGSVSGSGIYPWTHWAVSSDTASTTQAIADLQIDHNFGGTGYGGGRIGMLVNFVPTGAVTNGGIIEGVQASIVLPAMGGTNLNTGAKGSAAGMNPYIIFNTGATNLSGASCIEADMAAKAGSSYQTMNAFFAVHTASHVVGASSSDVAFLASDQVGSAVTSTAFAQVGYRASQWPLKSTGAIVRAELGTSAGSPSTAAYGDDYLLATFSKAAFRSNGFAVDGSGTARIGTGFLTASSAGLAIDAKGVVGSFSSIATAGSNWPTDGLQYYATDAFDGVWSLTLSGGSVTGVSVYRAPVTTGSPSTVLTLTPDPLASLWGATGLTINVTWDATRSGLSLNPTGKKLGFNGATPISQPAAPVTLADVIAIIRNYGLSA